MALPKLYAAGFLGKGNRQVVLNVNCPAPFKVNHPYFTTEQEARETLNRAGVPPHRHRIIKLTNHLTNYPEEIVKLVKP